MLMKAEALVQTAASDSDAVTLERAFNIVQTVNKRAMVKTATDTLLIKDYPNMRIMNTAIQDGYNGNTTVGR